MEFNSTPTGNSDELPYYHSNSPSKVFHSRSWPSTSNRTQITVSSGDPETHQLLPQAHSRSPKKDTRSEEDINRYQVCLVKWNPIAYMRRVKNCSSPPTTSSPAWMESTAIQYPLPQTVSRPTRGGTQTSLPIQLERSGVSTAATRPRSGPITGIFIINWLF
jgi:hypothetical protein